MNTKITKELIEKTIMDITLCKSKNSFSMFQGCRTYGIVERSENNLNICNDPNCLSCSEMDKTLKQELLSFNK
jgi:hypothetical protein